MKNLLIFLMSVLIITACNDNKIQSEKNDDTKIEQEKSDLKNEQIKQDTISKDTEEPKEETVQNNIKIDEISSIPLDTLLSFNSAEELKKVFGEENIKNSTGYYPEGMGEYNNTLLFPDTKNQVEFIWTNEKDYSELSNIVLSQKNTDWKTKEGITIGTTLKELEKINEKSFIFSGFDWDYSGMTNFSGGYLTKRHISAYLEYPGGVVPNDEYDALIGDVTIDSKSEIAQKVNPVIAILSIGKNE